MCFSANMDKSLWKKVAVVGAAGKMGRGISLLILQEMARMEAEEIGIVGSGKYGLFLVDTFGEGVFGLKKYLRPLITVFAEKNINQLRGYYARNQKLVSNGEIIESFVEGSMDLLQLSTEISTVRNSKLVFEAIHEDTQAKTDLYNLLKEHAPEAYYFSNTSSIPIRFLNDQCKLNNRIIGCHFYNPPHIQKLIEIIPANGKESPLFTLTQEICHLLKKTIVVSNDIAGFIGNGHFIREVRFACKKAEELAKKSSLPEAISLLNFVSQEFLIRPMGIFQLIDYIGIDICQKIIEIMRKFLPDPTLVSHLIDSMIEGGIKGGQNSDGTQKNGFFQYEGLKPTAIYSLKESRYIPQKPEWLTQLGHLPSHHIPWKTLHKNKDRKVQLTEYFHQLFQMKTLGSQLSLEWLKESQQIAEKLVADGVAKSMKDVTTVLENGFFHLYGPDEPFHALSLVKTEASK